MIKSITLLGAGNVALNLCHAFLKANIQINQIFCRSTQKIQQLTEQQNIKTITNLNKLNKNADLYILAVPDRIIPEIINALPFKPQILVHTAGSVPVNCLSDYANHFGVFYPLQTFTKNKIIDFYDIPICIEADTPETEYELIQLAKKISGNIQKINTTERELIHLAAVIANNFTNHFYTEAFDFLETNRINPDILIPLIHETANKIITNHPKDNQTGPAIRNDFITIKKHIGLLNSLPDLKNLYKFVSKSIQKKNMKNKLNFKEQLTTVQAFIFDVDGVFSNNVYLYPNGELMRSMNIKDGFAVQYAVKQGYPIGIISGGKSESVRVRFKGLGVTDIYLASVHKMEDFKDFYMKYNLNPDNILYMGDDLPDYEVMKTVGIATCPADAAPEIQSISTYISDKAAGEGCVRDVIEQVLRAQNKWPVMDKEVEAF